MSFEVKIHQSQTLTGYCEDEYGGYNDDIAANNVVETIESVFDQQSNFDIDASVGETDIELPMYYFDGSSASSIKQDLRAEYVYTGSNLGQELPYSGPHPEGSDKFEMFDNGLHWWREYAQERISSRAEHSNLLLTSTEYSSGAKGFTNTYSDSSNYSISRTGQLCAEYTQAH